jgi:hypothetical protein
MDAYEDQIDEESKIKKMTDIQVSKRLIRVVKPGTSAKRFRYILCGF